MMEAQENSSQVMPKVEVMEWTQKVSEERRRQMIADAAYFRAERRGFDGGDPFVDWLEAEHEIDARLGGPEGDGLLERFDAQLAHVSQRLGALRTRVGELTAEAREEWHSDVERLAALNSRFSVHVDEMKAHGVQASAQAKQHAERLWAEISEILHRCSSRDDKGSGDDRTGT